jgi:predicted ArsR family transcriptional regulator
MNTYSDQIAQVSAALSDPTRREIMEYVMYSEGSLSVRDVAEHFELHANAARMHLDKLVKSGLLRVIRRRGPQGGRPAHHYDSVDRDWDLHIPPRHYKVLADILAGAMCGVENVGPEGIELQALRSGREQAMRSSSPIAYLQPDADIVEVVRIWLKEIERRGLKASWETLEDGEIEVNFSTCPFGDLSSRYPGLVCEIHRLLEQGFLSLAGNWRLEACEFRPCAFRLKSG